MGKKKTAVGRSKTRRAKRVIKTRGAKKPAATKRSSSAKAGRSRTKSQSSRSASGMRRGVKKTSAGPGRKKLFGAMEKRKFRDLLIHLREHLTGQINFLATDNLSRTQNDSEVDFRSEEQGTDNYDRDMALNRVSLEQDTIFEIDEALNRSKIGIYGSCESCGRSIEKARLAAVPYSRMCVACQSAMESGRKGMRASERVVFPDAEKVAEDIELDEE